MNALLATPIAYLKGVGPQKAQTLQEELGPILELSTGEDWFLPDYETVISKS